MNIRMTAPAVAFQGLADLGKTPIRRQLLTYLEQNGLKEGQIAGIGGNKTLTLLVADEATQNQVAALLKDPNDATGQKLVFQNKAVIITITGPFQLFADSEDKK